MAFIESPRFPIDIGYGSINGFRFKTEIVEYQNGKVYRNSRWDSPLIKVNVKNYIKNDQSKIATVVRFFNACQGKANGFRVKDYLDFTTHTDGVSNPSNNDQTLGTGDNVEVDFQLVKKYTVGSVTTTRNIKKPVSGSVLVAVNGVAQSEGSQFSVNNTTGLVTFSTPPGAGLSVTAGCKFDVPCRFDIDELTDIEYILNRGDPTRNIIVIPDIPIVELRNP